MATVTSNCRLMLGIVRCFVCRDWGFREDDLRQLDPALFTSRFMHSFIPVS